MTLREVAIIQKEILTRIERIAAALFDGQSRADARADLIGYCCYNLVSVSAPDEVVTFSTVL